MAPKKQKKISDVTVIDNFLAEEDFATLKDIFVHPETHWYLTNGIAYPKETNAKNHMDPLNNWMFTHALYNDMQAVSSGFQRVADILLPAVKAVKGNEFQALTRIKSNLYPRTEELQIHPFHVDANDVHWKGCLICLNTCDGYTGFDDGTEVDSVENRAIFFDATERHHSTNCTNASYRLNININYV